MMSFPELFMNRYKNMNGCRDDAAAILSALGIPASNAVTMFYRQVVLQKGLLT